MDTRAPVIDFIRYISERTINFTGREWVFQAINDWLADPDGSRFFLLRGEPGSGKTAISARLSQFSQGLSSPNGLPKLTRGYLSAIHFCSARDTTWIDPLIFAGSLATQLANRYPAYLKLLEDLHDDKQIGIDVKQTVQEVVNGQVIGVVINVSGPSPESAFNRVVREPLKALLGAGVNEQVVILVDALDEALSYSGTPTIVSLLAKTDHLSPQVRFLLTTRQEERVENQFLGVNELSLSIPGDQRNQDDIHRYLKGRLQKDLQLAEKAALVERSQVTELVEAVSRKAEANFLYVSFLLDAMAKGFRSLTELEGLPEGLDWLYFDSLRRVVDLGKRDWFNEYRPLMGVLSVAQESLTIEQLQAFTAQPESSIWQYLSDLQQFIQEASPQNGKVGSETRYRLYHQSVIDFLGHQKISIEQRQSLNSYYIPLGEWHKNLANVCEQGDLSLIWDDIQRNAVEQSRRVYARHYYIIHLYQAQEWSRLFAVLDEGVYGRAKVQRYDLGTHSYSEDLILGQQAAVWKEWTMAESIALLPHLWRYTLLKCNLASRADKYPLAAYQVLLLLKREPEAVGLAELLPNSAHKANVMLQIASYLAKQPGRESESIQMLIRSYTIARSVEHSAMRDEVLRELGIALGEAQQWEQAETVVQLIEVDLQRSEALSKLGTVCAQAQRLEEAKMLWTKAHTVAQVNLDILSKPEALRVLGSALFEAGQRERAEAMWAEAQEAASSITVPEWKVAALGKLGVALAVAGQLKRASAVWAEAQGVVRSLPPNWKDIRGESLRALGTSLAEAGQLERAEVLLTKAQKALLSNKREYWRDVRDNDLSNLIGSLIQAQLWERAEALVPMIENKNEQTKALRKLGIALAQAQQWKQVEAVIASLDNFVAEQIEVRSEVAVTLAQTQQLERAEGVWNQIQAIIHLTERSEVQVKVLGELGIALALAQQWERAEQVWAEALVRAKSNEIDVDDWRSETMDRMGISLAQAQQWEQAEAVARTIKDDNRRAVVLRELGISLARAQQWERAQAVVPMINDAVEQREVLCELGIALARAQQWERADAMIASWHLTFPVKAKVLGELALALVQAQQWERAEAILTQVEEEANKRLTWKLLVHEVAMGLSELGAILALMHQWERAQTMWNKAKLVASQSDYDRWTDEALSELVAALGRVQQWEQAEAVARSISKRDVQATAFRKLTAALAQAHLWERAEAVASSIEERDEQVRALHELVVALAQAQQWEHAQTIARLIKDVSDRVRALCEVTEVLVAVGDFEQVVRIVQIWWLQVDSSEDAIQMLLLATGLIPLKPEVGTAFCEAFTWVDNFLKR